MANDCCGTMRVVSKDKKAIERLRAIINYEDPEYFCYRCRAFDLVEDVDEIDGFYVADFAFDVAWSSEPWFDNGDHPDKLIVNDYEKNSNGTKKIDPMTNEPIAIHGTAHLTDLNTICKVLKIGLELYSTEPGCCFCEHRSINSEGETIWNETDDYNLVYPENENGEPDYDKEPEEQTDMDLWNFGTPDEIYYGE